MPVRWTWSGVSRSQVFLVASLAVLALVTPLAAQTPAKIPRIGCMITPALDSPESRSFREAFGVGLREHGYVEGRNVLVEYRGAASQTDRFPALAAELVQLKVDVIVAANTPAVRGARQATTLIPIVAAAMGDPVGDGFAVSLARPGGNVTGLTFLGPELVPKRLELLKTAMPRLHRVAGLWHPGEFSRQTSQEMRIQAEEAARRLGLQLELVSAEQPTDIEGAFATVTRVRAEAIMLFPSPMLFNERRRLVQLLERHRLPSIGVASEFAEVGGLMTYGPSLADLYRRTASYVDKILKGARPGELSIEQPTVFELVVNAKTAKHLGLDIPPALQGRADRVLE